MGENGGGRGEKLVAKNGEKNGEEGGRRGKKLAAKNGEEGNWLPVSIQSQARIVQVRHNKLQSGNPDLHRGRDAPNVEDGVTLFEIVLSPAPESELLTVALMSELDGPEGRSFLGPGRDSYSK